MGLHQSFIVLIFSMLLANQAMANETVKSVQVILNKLGYNVGSPDGISGPKTRTAINNFYSQKLPNKFDGVIDANELSDLQNALDQSNLKADAIATKLKNFQDCKSAKSCEVALRELQSIADHGTKIANISTASFFTGLGYLNGTGTKKSVNKAKVYLTKSAKTNGFYGALAVLAGNYSQGSMGFEKNYFKAYVLAKVALEDNGVPTNMADGLRRITLSQHAKLSQSEQTKAASAIKACVQSGYLKCPY